MNDLARNYFLSTYAGESRLRHTRAKDRRNPRRSRTRQKFVCNWLRGKTYGSAGTFDLLAEDCSAPFVQSELVSV